MVGPIMLVLVEFSSTLPEALSTAVISKQQTCRQLSRGKAILASVRPTILLLARGAADDATARSPGMENMDTTPTSRTLHDNLFTRAYRHRHIRDHLLISAWIANCNQYLGYHRCLDGQEGSRTLSVNQCSDNVDLSPLQHRRGACRPLFLS